jgi:hypothetical protein
MSTAKLEKIIDLLINEDHERAEQLFHEIVVEKSREIYESLMDEDMTTGLMDEISDEQEGMDSMMEDDDEFMDAEIEDDDISVDDDEEDMDVDSEFSDGEDGEEFGDEEEVEMDSDGVTKDDIMNLEDKLDQLMAEFESEFGSDEEEEEEGEEEEEEEGEDSMMEAVELKKVSVTHGDNGAQTRSPVVANSGAKGPVGSVVKPVKFSGDSETVPTSPKDPSNYGTKGEKMSGAKYQNAAGTGASGVKGGRGESAPKPVTKDEAGKVRSPVAEGRRTKKRI